jgi:hypothetical protein
MPDPIIIKGGSLTIEFNRNEVPPVSGEPNQNGNPNMTVTSIIVRDDNTGQERSFPVPNNGKVTVTIQAQ